MRAHLYTVVYRYIRPLPPLAPPAYRGATEGPGPPSCVGSSEEPPCPDLGLCALPSAPAGAAVGGWASPPPDGCTCRVKPRLKSPPPSPAGRQTGCCAPVLRGAPLTVCPTCCPAPPCRIAAHLCLPCPPAVGGGGGGCAALGGGVDHPVPDPGPVPDTPDPEQQPLAAPVPATQHALQHPAAPVCGGVGRHLNPAQLEAIRREEGGGRGGLEPKSLCTGNGLINISCKFHVSSLLNLGPQGGGGGPGVGGAPLLLGLSAVLMHLCGDGVGPGLLMGICAVTCAAACRVVGTAIECPPGGL